MARVLMLSAVCLMPAALGEPEPCPAGETCAIDEASLLSLSKVNADSQAMCNEALFQGLCYRTCSNMGEMEPRRSATNCGGVHSSKFAAACGKDGPYTGSGVAPGTGGRPKPPKDQPNNGCRGESITSQPKPPEDQPNMCTQDKPAKGGLPATWKCSKPEMFQKDAKKENKPKVEKNGTTLTCECPLEKDSKASSILTTTTHNSCNTGCSDAEGYVVYAGIAYCCPDDKKPIVEKHHPRPPVPRSSYLVTCSCNPVHPHPGQQKL